MSESTDSFGGPLDGPLEGAAAPSAPAADSFSTAADRSALLRAYLSAGVAALCWSSNAVAVKFIVRDIPAFRAGLLRITLAAATLAAIRLLMRRPFSIRPADRRSLMQMGLLGIGGSFLMFTAALARTSVAHTVFIWALIPMAVLLLACRKGQERVSWRKLTGLTVCLLGVLLLALDHADGTTGNWSGDLMAFVGMWCFAFFIVTSKGLAPHYDSFSMVTYAFVVAAMFLLPFSLWSVATIPWDQVRWTAWAGLGYSATIGSGGAYLAFCYALKTLTASQVAAFQYAQPVLATCFGVLFLAEAWGAGFLIAAALILAGILLIERR